MVFQSLYLIVQDTCDLGPHFNNQWGVASWPDSQWEARQQGWTPGRRTLGKGESLFALKMLQKIYMRNLQAYNQEKTWFLQYCDFYLTCLFKDWYTRSFPEYSSSLAWNSFQIFDNLFVYLTAKNQYLYWKFETSILFWELRSHMIDLPIQLQEICRPILGIYKSSTNTWM